MGFSDRWPEIKERLNAQGVREWINNNSAAVTVGAVALLVVSLAIIISQGRGAAKPTPGNGYFFDTVTKEIFTDKATRIPPIQSPDGHDAVRVHFFTCNECTDKTDKDGGERFIGYFEKYAPEVKARLEKSPQSFELYEMAFQGRLYSTDGEKWIPAESPAGFKLTEALQKKCPPRKLRYCPPK
jgi:hypothetical protein